MNPISQTFNAAADWNADIWPLFILLMIAEEERREARRKKRLLKLQSAFWEATLKDSRDRYRRQVAEKRAFHQYRMAGPRP